MRGSTVLIVVAMAASIAVLSALGAWQVARLSWKEGLIAQTNARVAAQPVSLKQIEELWIKNSDVDYLPVKLKGVFDHTRELYYYNTLNGNTGWNVFTPLILPDNRRVLLNRGFVPDHLKYKETRQSGLVEGSVEITGLARNPVLEKPNSLIPDNQLSRREFFWKSYSQMVSLSMSENNNTFLPFMIDQGKNDIESGYPIGGTTRIHFTNNHLQYAVTWFGLALTAFVIGSLFLYSGRKQAA